MCGGIIIGWRIIICAIITIISSEEADRQLAYAASWLRAVIAFA